MTDDTIHTCSYECERPGCIRAQRDELAARLEALTSAPQPASAGEEVIVSTPNDVFILTLQPSGLDGEAPRFVVHVPETKPAAVDDQDTQVAEIERLRAEVAELRAARIAYASEFPATKDGDPDTGNIHANIRALKARAERLAEALEDIRSRMRLDPFDRLAELDNILQIADAALAQENRNDRRD